MLEVVTGQRRHLFGEKQLEQELLKANLNGTLYIGYPIIAAADEPTVIEALLTCREHGVVAFQFEDRSVRSTQFDAVEEHQNDLHSAIYQKLLGYKPLRSGRGLSVEINVITIAPEVTGSVPDGLLLTTPNGIGGLLAALPGIIGEQLRLVNAAIQRITTIKPANKRTKVTRPNSRGAVMQVIEREIANLDQWQKKAAIESPEGPQRIRGLAGSGKTIVLALKAAYLHTAHPDWDIVVTFYTRALYQQFRDLIRRFCFEHLGDEPNWHKLRVLHTWGSSRAPGVYSEISAANDVPVRDLAYGRSAAGDNAFEAVCEELLTELKKGNARQLFDAILIDEAQDLPRAFFEICYLSTRAPKRVVWAYDELQNLGSYSMAPPSELFGTGSNGTPNVPDLHENDGIKRDIILPVCYRNTPWALTTAHAIGFGIYRERGLVQFFDNAALWSDVGYEVVKGELSPGSHAVLARRPDSYPEYFKTFLDPTDAVQFHAFESPDAQAQWVASAIKRNITEDELDFRDILVVLPDPYTSRSDAAMVIEALGTLDVPAHLVGVSASADAIFQEGSIAISSIYRAKGNEAPMVYLLNSNVGATLMGIVARRNALFTAITRSRAWVRVCGWGVTVGTIRSEFEKVKEHGFKLEFDVPTEEQLQRIRKIHRDMSRDEIAALEKLKKEASAILDKIRKGDLMTENLPLEILELAKLASSGQDES